MALSFAVPPLWGHMFAGYWPRGVEQRVNTPPGALLSLWLTSVLDYFDYLFVFHKQPLPCLSVSVWLYGWDQSGEGWSIQSEPLNDNDSRSI